MSPSRSRMAGRISRARRLLALLVAAAALAVVPASVASAQAPVATPPAPDGPVTVLDTFSWSAGISESWGLVRTVTSTSNGTPRIRFDVDNPHSVYVKAVPSGANPDNYPSITIPAHDQTYHYVAQSFAAGQSVGYYLYSALGSQFLSGYILA